MTYRVLCSDDHLRHSVYVVSITPEIAGKYAINSFAFLGLTGHFSSCIEVKRRGLCSTLVDKHLVRVT